MQGRHSFYYWDRDTNEVTPCSIETWGTQMQDGTNRVNFWSTDSPWGGQDIQVSTVFLGVDHNFSTTGPPILWETMIFGMPEESDLNERMWRYASYREAYDGHQSAVRQVKRFLATKRNGVTHEFDFVIKPDWDEMARLVMNKISGIEIDRRSWRMAPEDFDVVKDKHVEIAKLIVEQYERYLLRKGRVIIRKDDLTELAKLLGPMRGALVKRINAILGRSDENV